MVSISTKSLATVAAALSTLCNATSMVSARAQSLQLLFLDTAPQPLTAYIQKAVSNGPTTYIINCVSQDAADCTIHDATLTVNPGLSYDFHKSINLGGAMTIHCTYAADGRSPASCTTTVAGGPNGYDVTTAAPTADQWAYLPVQVVDKPSDGGAYAYPSATAAVGDGSGTVSAVASGSPGTSSDTSQTVFDGAGCRERAEMSVILGCVMLMLMAQIGLFSW